MADLKLNNVTTLTESGGGVAGTFSNVTASGNVTVSGDLVPSEPLSHRNMIYNGGMQIFQRATSAVTATTTFDTADRWRIYDPSSGSFTSEKHTMAFAELNTTGHRTALKLACTGVSSAGVGDHAYFFQPLEGQDLQKLQYGTANAKTVTISFWVKSTITGTYCVSLYTVGGTNYQVAKEYTISSADTWEYKTITITPTEGSTSLMTSSASLIANDNGGGAYLYFFLVSGSSIYGTANEWGAGGTRYATSNQVNWLSNTSNTFYITGIQMELGQNATPFEHRTYNDELERCQRYLQHHQAQTAWAPFGNGQAISTTSVEVFIPFITAMRTQPTITENLAGCSDGANAVLDVTGTGAIYWTTQGTNITFTVSGATQYRSYSVISNASSAGYLRLDSEIQ